MTSAKKVERPNQTKPNQTKPNQHIMADDFPISELVTLALGFTRAALHAAARVLVHTTFPFIMGFYTVLDFKSRWLRGR